MYEIYTWASSKLKQSPLSWPMELLPSPSPLICLYQGGVTRYELLSLVTSSFHTHAKMGLCTYMGPGRDLNAVVCETG